MLDGIPSSAWDPTALRRDGVLKVALGVGYDDHARRDVQTAASLVAGLEKRGLRQVDGSAASNKTLEALHVAPAQLTERGDYYADAGGPCPVVVRIVTPNMEDPATQFATAVGLAPVTLFAGHGRLGTAWDFGPLEGTQEKIVFSEEPTLHRDEDWYLASAERLSAAIAKADLKFADLPLREGARMFVNQTCNSVDMNAAIREAVGDRAADGLLVAGTQKELGCTELVRGTMAAFDNARNGQSPKNLAVALAEINGGPTAIDLSGKRDGLR